MIALYARVSLEDQVEQYSLASQLRSLREHAQAKGYTVAEEFVDDGYSGGDLDRPALDHLRERIREHAVTHVLVYDPDRLTRKVAHAAILQEEAEKSGCEYVFLSTPAAPTSEGQLFLAMKSIFAEYERAKIAERSARGRKEKSRQGYVMGGVTPYGYNYLGKAQGSRGTLVINEEQAGAVRQIFQWALDGYSIREIAIRLTAAGVKPKYANRWGRTTIARILANETYSTGIAFYNRRQRTLPKNPSSAHRHRRNKKTCLVERPRAEWIPITVPSIISKELFERVQEQLREHKHRLAGRPSKEIYQLKGLLICERCNRRWHGNPSHGKRYYRCDGHNRLLANHCDLHMIPANILEDSVWNSITAAITSPGLLTALITNHLTTFTTTKNHTAEITMLEQQIKRLKNREARATQALLDSDLHEHYCTFTQELQTATNERRAAQARLDQLRAARPTFDDIHDRINDRVARIKAAIENAAPIGRRAVLREIITKISINEYHATIHAIIPQISDKS